MGIEGEGKGVTKLMAHDYKFDAVQQRVVAGMAFTVVSLSLSCAFAGRRPIYARQAGHINLISAVGYDQKWRSAWNNRA